MINAGFNPLTIMSEKTGKSVSQLKEEMSKGAISAEMVQQAFIDATSAGGKFYNMSQNASKELSGQLSMFQDALDNTFNELGAKSEGFLMGGIKLGTKLVENYETVGKVLLTLISTYGSYKAALMVATLMESKHSIAQIARYKTTLMLNAAQKLLNNTIKANPYVFVASALFTLITAMVLFRDRTTDAEKAQKKFNEELKATKQAEQERKQHLEDLISTMQDETAAQVDRMNAMDEIKKAYPALFQKYIDEKGHIKDMTGLWREYNEERARALMQENKSKANNVVKDIEDYKKLMNISGEDFVKLRNLKGNENYKGFTKSRYDELLNEKGWNQSIAQFASKRIKELEAIKPLYDEQVYKDRISQYKVGIKSLTDEQIKAEIESRERVIKWRKDNPMSKISDFAKGDMGLAGLDAKSNRMLTDELNALKSQQAESEKIQKKVSESNKRFWEEEKKKYQAELEGLDSSKKGTKEWNDIVAKINKADKEIDKYSTSKGGTTSKQKEVIDNAIAFERELSQATIDAMNEGAEKEKAQRELNWKNEINDIEKKRQEALKNANTSDKKNNINSHYDALKVQVQKKQDNERKKIDKEEKERQEEAMRQYLEDWGTYEEKKLAITQKYQKLIEKATDEGTKKGLQKQLENELNGIDIKSGENLKKVFGDIANMSKDTLAKNLKIAREELDKLLLKKGDNVEQIAELQKRINELDSALEDTFSQGGNVDWIGIVKSFEKINRLQKEYNAEIEKNGESDYSEKLLAKLEKKRADFKRNLLASGADTFANSLGVAAQYMQEISDISGDTKLSELAETLKGFSNVLGSISQGFQQGGFIGAILNGAGSLISGLISDIFNGKKYKSQIKQFKKDFENEMNLLSLKIDNKDFESIFGVNYIAKAKDAWEKASKALNEYNSLVSKNAEITAKLTGSPLSSKGKTTAELLKQQKDAVKKGYTELEAMSIKTTKRGWFAKMFGAGDKFTSLKDLAPDIFKDGGFDIEKAKIFLETNHDIDDTQRREIQNVIKLKEAYDNAMQEIDSILSDFLGNMATDMADAIWDSVVNGGEDAWGKWQDIGKDAIAQIGKQMLQELIITEHFDKWKDRLREALGSGDTQAFANMVVEMVNGMGDAYETSRIATEAYYSAIKAQGIDLRDSSSQSASTGKGFQTMSQDLGTELNGRFTDLQMTGREIKTEQYVQGEILRQTKDKIDVISANTVDIRNIADETRTLIADSYIELKEISANTGNTVKELEKTNEHLKKIKESVENI